MCSFPKTLSLIVAVLFFSTVRASDPTPLELFEQRIAPIFESPNPSSCVQCHLSSVDLKDYILPSSRDTFLSLRNQGLINLESPEESKILTLISMGDLDSDKLAKRIHAKTRQAEYEAFAAWISACCSDPELMSANPDASSAVGPKRPDAVVRHNRKDRILDSFSRNVWSQRMRCFPCHTPDEIDAENPRHTEPAKRYREYVQQYGARMNLFTASPETSLRNMIASSKKPRDGALPLINVDTPLDSLLILKPTGRIPAKGGDGKLMKPSSAIPVTHGGGLKIHKDDHSYKAFAAWLQDYSQATKDGYDSPEELPADNWIPTQQVLRVKSTPENWPVMGTVQLFVYAKKGETDQWEPEPIAFTQARIAPRKIVNGPLFLFASPERESGDAPKLAPGEYLIQAYLDHDEQIPKDPTLLLNTREPDATATVDAQWLEGFKDAQILVGSDFKS